MNIPEGYVLVPINATSAMIEHGKDERMQCLASPSLSVQGALVRIYSAMIGSAQFVCESDEEEHDDAKERELFEALTEKECPGADLRRCGKEEESYMNFYVAERWIGWKSCAKYRARSAE